MQETSAQESSTPAADETIARPISIGDTARRYWLPLISFIALALCCTDTDYRDGHKLAVLLSGRGNLVFIASGILFLLFVAWQRRAFWPIRRGLEFSALCLVLVNVLRYASHLPRPPHIRHGVIVVNDKFSAGFPSSHTAFAFGLAWLILEIKPPFAVFWFAAAVAIGWARIELFAHYPYQVLCGALLGALLAFWVSHAPRGVLASMQERFAVRKNS